MPHLSLRYALIAEGNTDHVLIAILEWLFATHQPDIILDADAPFYAGGTVEQRFRHARSEPNLDFLFIHRDTDRETLEKRREEISELAAQYWADRQTPVICIIPVRMTEA
jgi:hypothetical protein